MEESNLGKDGKGSWIAITLDENYKFIKGENV
jgi:hypothetical protein